MINELLLSRKVLQRDGRRRGKFYRGFGHGRSLTFAAGIATFSVALGVAALAVTLTGGFAAAFSVVFVVDNIAAMSVATPVAVLGGTESCCGQQYNLFAGRP